MPPQPLSKVRRDAVPLFGYDALNRRPQLAVRVAGVIAAWAEVEVTLGRVLATLLGSDASAVMAMHAALNGFQARADTLEAAARARLPQGDRDVFFATMGAVRRAATRRHEFAHWLWGYCRELPDALLLAEPKKYWAKSAEAHERHMRAEGDKLARVAYMAKLDHSEILVYRARDLLEAWRSTAAAVMHAELLTCLAEPGYALHDQARRQLSCVPEIRTALDKLRRDGAPRQEALPPPRQTTDVY